MLVKDYRGKNADPDDLEVSMRPLISTCRRVLVEFNRNGTVRRK